MDFIFSHSLSIMYRKKFKSLIQKKKMRSSKYENPLSIMTHIMESYLLLLHIQQFPCGNPNERKEYICLSGSFKGHYWCVLDTLT